MKARECDIETAEGRCLEMQRLASELFYQYAERVLDKPSRSVGTGDLSCLEFAKQGKEQYRAIEGSMLFSGANVSLSAILRTYKRYMPQLDSGYAGRMIAAHGVQYNPVINAFDLQDADQRVACLQALYEAHGWADGIDVDSAMMTFDHETVPHDFITRAFSNSAHIHKPQDAAHYSYIGLMNAICDLFLNLEKQNPDLVRPRYRTRGAGSTDLTDWNYHAA